MDYINKDYDIKVNGPEELSLVLEELVTTPNQTKFVYFQMDAARQDSQQALFKVDTHVTPCKIAYFDLNEHAATSAIMAIIQQLTAVAQVAFFDVSKAYRNEQNKPFLMGLEKRMYVGHHHNVNSARELLETIRPQPALEAVSPTLAHNNPIPDKSASKLGRFFGLFSGSFGNKNKHIEEKSLKKKNTLG